ncbi:MAG: type II toxin-antitoxin system VapB family antitoxin [Candidatus Electronema sp. VV]
MEGRKMQQSAVSLKNIICGIQSLPPDALLELDHFVTFLHHKTDSSAQRKAASTGPQNLKEELLAIGRHCAALPLLDSRTPDQILGYNEQGLPE